MIILTSKITGKPHNIDIEGYSKLVEEVGEDRLKELYSLRIAEFNRYIFQGWIHSKRGGDDYPFDSEILAETESEAREIMVTHLKKHSSVLDDFRLVEAREGEK